MKCNKRTYLSRKEAKKIAKIINMLHPNDNKHTAYCCNLCGLYHTTTMKPQESRDFGRYLRNKQKST